MIRKLCAAASAGLVAVLVLAQPAAAHPLGNFTVNTAAALRVSPEGVAIDYAIDLAEIPTLQVKGDLDADGDGTFTDAEQTSYRDRECRRVADALDVNVDGKAIALTAAGTSISIVEGLASLSTARITCLVTGPADLGNASHAITFASTYAAGRVGWTKSPHGATACASKDPTSRSSARASPSPSIRAVRSSHRPMFVAPRCGPSRAGRA